MPPRQRTNSMPTSAMSIIAMPSCPAPLGSSKARKPSAAMASRQLAPQPGRAGHGAVLMGDVDLQRQLAAFGDGSRSGGRCRPPRACDGYRSGARISMVKETCPGMTLVAPGIGVDVADGADQAVRVGPAKLLDRDDAFGGARQRIAPQRHRHRAGMTGHAGEADRQPRGAGDRRDHADRQIVALQHRPLLDVQFDIGEQFAAARAPPRRYDRGRDRIAPAPRASRCRRWSLTASTLSSNVPATARLPSRVDAKRTPSSSAKPVTSTANGSRTCAGANRRRRRSR